MIFARPRVCRSNESPPAWSAEDVKRSHMRKTMLLVASGTLLAGLFPGCLLPLAPVGSRLAGNGIIDVLLSLIQ